MRNTALFICLRFLISICIIILPEYISVYQGVYFNRNPFQFYLKGVSHLKSTIPITAYKDYKEPNIAYSRLTLHYSSVSAEV